MVIHVADDANIGVTNNTEWAPFFSLKWIKWLDSFPHKFEEYFGNEVDICKILSI